MTIQGDVIMQKITRLLSQKYIISDLPNVQVVQSFDLYQTGGNIYLFAQQQGNSNGTTRLSLYRLENNVFKFQCYRDIAEAGHGHSLAVEGGHLWIVGTKDNSTSGTLYKVPVIKRLSFNLTVGSDQKTQINWTGTKVIKNLVYKVVAPTVDYKNLKEVYIGITGTRMCIKTSFQNVSNVSGGYYRVYSLADMNSALDSISGSELSLDTAAVGSAGKLATFRFDLNGKSSQCIDVDGAFVYISTGGNGTRPKALKLEYATKTKGSTAAATIQDLGGYTASIKAGFIYEITLYRTASDTGSDTEAEGIQCLASAMGGLSSANYIIPGEMSLRANKKATLYMITSTSV